MADYPQGGYRNRGARELSTPERRNTIPPKQAGAVGRPPNRTGGDLRNITVIPPNNPPSVVTPPAGGKTIHINGGQLQTIIDNGRIRNAPNAGNGLTIELSPKEYREFQQGKTRGALRGILRALGRNPLFRDLRMRLALQILESLLEMLGQPMPFNTTGEFITPAAGWEHWSYNPQYGVSAAGTPAEIMEGVEITGSGSTGHPEGVMSYRAGLSPAVNAGWTNAPHETTLGGQSLSGAGPNNDYASVWHLTHYAMPAGLARWRIVTSYRRVTGSNPWSWSLMSTTAWSKVGPHNFAAPTGRAAPKTGTKGNGGYNPPGLTATKTEPFPEPPPVRTRERKLRARGAAAALWFGVGSVTEAMDLINAIWNALPGKVKYRAFVKNGYKKLNPYERAVVIFNNLDKVNLPQAILNVVEDQIEDVLWGKVGKGIGQSTQIIAPDRPIGLGAGGWMKHFEFQRG